CAGNYYDSGYFHSYGLDSW
nr:immunoglobulin heavy chain junction region [Macaca mulatta]MOV50978.1 immunoglobulin heavy chain junction region [Macaca mulatta]